MPMKFIIKTPEDLLAQYQRLLLDAIMQEKQADTQRERKYHSGQVAAYAEAIFFLKEHVRTLAEANVTEIAQAANR